VTPPRNDLSAPVRATTPWTGPRPVGLTLERDWLWAHYSRRCNVHAPSSCPIVRAEAPSVRVVEATDADLAAIRAAGYSVVDARAPSLLS
jgi:hypothetical protein